MSVKETPKANRYLDLKEKERAYRKHMEAVANAKATIDTTAPEPSNRLKAKEKADARYRKQLKTDFSKRERMIASVHEGERKEIFPDDYYPEDDDEIDFDELVKKYGDDLELVKDELDAKAQEKTKSPQQINNIPPKKATSKKETIRFGYGKDDSVQIEEHDDTEENIQDNVNYILNGTIDKLTAEEIVPIASIKAESPKEKQRPPSKIPRKTSTSSSKDMKQSKNLKKDEKGTTKEKESTLKRSSRPTTATSTMSFENDFEDDFEDDFADQSSNDEKSESSQKDTNETGENFESDSNSNKDEDEQNKEELNDADEHSTEPMEKIQPVQLKQDSDDMPELEFPDF